MHIKAVRDNISYRKLRKQLLQNHLVEAIVILPRNMFYSTDISVTLWILNNNKKARTVEQNGKMVRYRNREDEVLFIDLHQGYVDARSQKNAYNGGHQRKADGRADGYNYSDQLLFFHAYLPLNWLLLIQIFIL